ncbi:MAG: 3-deoxy-D-manno-octulosonic acid transferase [Alistipes sp.]|nr:3-deoxy-D-manno-octulosonic acid transferase [Alistipes sp.]
MKLLYTLCMAVYAALIRFASLFNRKAKQWCDGRRGMVERMRETIGNEHNIVWIHVASLGDFEQGRPLVDYIKENYPDYKILLTFFSPSGYEVRKNYPNADYVFYIPQDTKREVVQFLDAARPKIAIFVKYEFWLNMLTELGKRNIRTFIVSSIFRRNSIFFNRPFGGIWRKALGVFETIFVQDEASKKLLAEIGVENVVVAGDTRFDRVQTIADSAEKVEVVEQFKGDSRLFVAGSTWAPDEEILLPLIKANPDVKFVIAPHEMDGHRIERILHETKAVRYTQCEGVEMSDKQVLVLDTMGLLSRVYGSAEWAYVGGGFGAGIHNTLEAAVYGIPVAFGKRYHKFKEARDLIALGVGRSVKNERELQSWFDELKSDADYLARLSVVAKLYVEQHRGTTERIVKKIAL